MIQRNNGDARDGIVASTRDGIVASTRDGIVASTRDGIVASTRDGIVASTRDELDASTLDEHEDSTPEAEAALLPPWRDRAAVLEALDGLPDDAAQSGPLSETQHSSGPPGVARYRFLMRLGAGGMGEVIQVRDRVLKRTVAMKLIRAHLVGQANLVTRFRREAEIAAQLEHPSIIPVYDVGCLTDGRHYYTMKEIRGRSLKEVIREVHQASPGDRWQPAPSGWTFHRLIAAFQNVCEAMAYAHSRGVIHRDLKPNNVMVGAFGEVLVLDWGLMRVLGAPPTDLEPENPADLQLSVEDELDRTRLGTIKGTPQYMPPEQACGNIEAMSERSDVYSLGAILYEILSDRPPYEGRGLEVLRHISLMSPLPPGRRLLSFHAEEATLDTVGQTGASTEASERTRQEEPLILDAPAPPMPEDLVAICQHAMARDPDARHPDAGALAEEIKAWLDGALKREKALLIFREAQSLPARIREEREAAARLQAEARGTLAGIAPFEPVAHKRVGWQLEAQANQHLKQAELLEIDYLHALRGSLTHDPDLPETYEALSRFYHRAHREAERGGDVKKAAESEVLLQLFDRNLHHARYLKGEGTLSLTISPECAEVALYRFEEEDRRLVPRLLESLGPGPVDRKPLKRGSYLLKIRAAGCAPVQLPVVIERMEDWTLTPPDAEDPMPLRLPTLAEVGPDDVYIPPGWCMVGGDPEAFLSFPRCRVWVDGLVMSRFQVTQAAYLAFINHLIASGQEEEALQRVPREPATSVDVAGPILYKRLSDGRFELPKDLEGDCWEADWPAFHLDWFGSYAYARWMGARTGLGWRLPFEVEWEKGARGVDARTFPWGNFLDPTWACIRDSHPKRRLPVGIHTYPLDESPYGVRGLAGNVRDWCLDDASQSEPPADGSRFVPPAFSSAPHGQRIYRGGAWSGAEQGARLATRTRTEPIACSAALGMRLVRSLEAPTERQDDG